MFAQTEHENITLPGLPDKFGDMTELKYHSVKKHGHSIFMVGGESNMGDSDNMIWSMDVRNLTDLKWTYYSQLQLQMQYSSFQIVHDKLLATTSSRPKAIEIFNLYNGRSVYYMVVF